MNVCILSQQVSCILGKIIGPERGMSVSCHNRYHLSLERLLARRERERERERAKPIGILIRMPHKKKTIGQFESRQQKSKTILSRNKSMQRNMVDVIDRKTRKKWHNLHPSKPHSSVRNLEQ